MGTLMGETFSRLQTMRLFLGYFQTNPGDVQVFRADLLPKLVGCRRFDM